MLFTKDTNAPNYLIQGDKIEGLLTEIMLKDKIGLIYFDIQAFGEVEKIYGYEACQGILFHFRTTVATLRLNTKDIKVVGWQDLGGDDAILIVAMDGKASYLDLCNLSSKLHVLALSTLGGLLNKESLPQVQLHVGYAFLEPPVKRKMESVLYSAIKEALELAKSPLNIDQRRQIEDLKVIIEEQNLSTVYQPIISTRNGEILGYEALSRGPVNSSLHLPAILFPLAERAGLLYQLEKTTRQLAIQRFAEHRLPCKLFLNLSSKVIESPDFSGGITKSILDEYGIHPHSIVWEITERNAINDFDNFRKALEHYRNQGYLIAIDDAGAGYSSLQTIAEIHPDFIKMDMSLVSGVAHSPVKRALLETFVTFAAKINATLIAEGIEEEEDLTTLIDIGFPFVQGYFIARPENPPPQATPELQNALKNYSRYDHEFEVNVIKARTLMQKTLSYPVKTKAKEVFAYFNSNSEATAVVILQGLQPVGLVMRERLYRHIATTQYGFSLYADKPIDGLMDACPLTVDAEAHLSNLAEFCRNRAGSRMYDDLIVTENGLYTGTIPVRKIFDALANLQIEIARVTNPMTNLPGGPIIQEQMRLVIEKKKPFAAVYVDLDNFKPLNDHYGFERGDKVIQMTARIICKAVNEDQKSKGDFIGHIGGDDFVFITQPEAVEQTCQKIIADFDREIINYYSDEDIKAGGIWAKNRDGIEQFFPFCSVSLAIVDNVTLRFTNYLQVSELLAELKHYAKTIPGSTFVRNRRNLKSAVI